MCHCHHSASHCCGGWRNAFLYAFGLSQQIAAPLKVCPLPPPRKCLSFSALQSPVVVHKALDLVSATSAALELASAAEVCPGVLEMLRWLHLSLKSGCETCPAAAPLRALLPSHLRPLLLLLELSFCHHA